MNFCTKEQERSIKTVIKRFFRKTPNGDLKNLESLISAELGIKDYKLNDVLTEDITKLLNLFGVQLSSDIDSTPSFKSNVVEEISSFEVDDLFHGLNLARAYFKNYVDSLVVKNYLIGYGDSYVNSDEELTKNFLRLKGDLFNKIQEFLISRNIINLNSPLNLYNDSFQITDYDYYKTIMQKISDYFFSGENFNLLKSYSGKNIPNIDRDMDMDSDIYEAYFNMIMLSNFDTILKKDFKNLISINNLYYNELISNSVNNTYTRVFIPESTLYWSNETHMEEGVESQNVKLAEMIANTIPAYDKNNVKALYNLEMNDFYLLGSIIANFELLHGNKLSRISDFKYFSTNVSERLQWYIETVKDVLDGKISDKLLEDTFSPYANIIYSLYNYLNDPELNILNKEKNSELSITSILGQVINNTFGASYTVTDSEKGITIQQMYSEDFNSTSINNTIYSKMASSNHNKSYYDLQNSAEAEKFLSVFNNIDPEMSAKDALSKNRSFFRRLRKYTYDKLGIKINISGFKTAMESMENTPGARGVFTVSDLKEKYRELLGGMDADSKSILFKNSLQNFSGATKFDSTVGELVESTISKSMFKALSKGYLMDIPIKGVMNIKTLNGESIPSYKIPNLTYKDTELFTQQREYENNTENPKVFKSLLIGDNPAIVGTATKLELINDNKSKPADKYYPVESFIGDLNYEFYDNIIKNKKFNAIIGAYSDKSTIILKTIDANFTDQEKGDPIIRTSIDNIIEKMRSQGRAYYYDTVKTVLDSYKELFEILGMSPFDFSIDINNLDRSVEFINNILSKNNIDQLIVRAQAHHLKITAELHYTKYAEGTYLNQLLIDNYKIFTNDSLFSTFIKNQEAAFLNNYNIINSTIGKTPITGDVVKYMEAVNINKNDYKNEDLRNVTLSNGDLNPLIRKWLWVNALFRNEYLFISTKGEYMHKIKGFNKRSGDFSDSYWDSYMSESHERLNAMSKRNVTNTSTFESPIRDTKYSIPTKLNMASIRDYKAMPYSITGDKKYTHNRNTNISEGNQDAHDGSTIIDATYSMMIDASYPSKGYSGTKKQFGTIVTEGGVVIKKDAESVLTNRKILDSTNAPIKGRELKRKMLSIPIGDVNLNYDVKLPPNYFFNDKGRIYRIGEIQLHNIEGKNVLFMSLYKKIGDNWIKQPPVQKDINNLFDLWTAFGGEYSTDIKGSFNESSNELLYKVMTDNLPLKHKLIHILSNESALKAGATNINPKSSWTDTVPFVYATFTSRFMGPQLDASHEANESEIKEVTQIIAALAQGGFTSEIAREAYTDIKNIIEDTAKSYIDSLNSESEDVLYEFLADNFIRSVVQSNGNNLAKVLVNNLKQDSIKIPFSNQNFYNAFVKDLITRMNTDFISRYYPGLGAVLVPSEGMIQLYDITLPDGTIKSVTQVSLIKEALENYNEKEFIEIYGEAPIDNDHIIQNYITRILPNEPITADKIEIGDTILWNNKEWAINTPDEYYDFKDLMINYSILNSGVPATLEKVWNRPRDLKPTMHTFNLENGESRNIFDLTGYKLKHYLDANNSEKYNNILNNLFLYISQKYLGEAIPLNRLNPDHKKLLKSFLNLWTQRDLSLMEINKLTPEVDEGTIFSDYFKHDDLTKDILEDVIEHYSVNGINISNVKFRPAEIIVADIFKSKFGRDETSLYDIKKQGFKYFQNKLATFYKKDNTNADIKIVTSNLDKPVYIRFVDNLKRYNENLNLRETFENGKQTITRYNDQGEKVYNLVNPRYTSAIIENGKEIILIQTGVVIKDDDSVTYHKTPRLDNILSSVIGSFKGSIQSLIPLMRDNSEIDVFTYTKKGNVSEVTGTEKFDLNLLSMNQFKRFTGYNKELPLERHSVFANKAVITENLAKIKYANWEKSHDVIASRIPAQSMQSFMPMRVVEYSDDSKNDAFVSISQIHLQGSDFDVDKAYLLGFNFDSRGKYHIGSNLTNFSTKEQIDALEKLPMPTNESIVIDLSGEDITSYYTEIVNTFNANPIGEEFSSETIESFNKLIRFINKNSIKSVNTSYDDPNVPLESIVLAINRHNTDNSGISRIDSLKNGVVSKINRVISSPSNQLLANSPINIDDWHNAVKKVLNNKTTYVKEEVIGSFENNDKLTSIGTANQYSRYINSVINGDERIIESLEKPKTKENIKPGVSELFESNTELANKVYEAVGFGKDSNYYEGNINPEPNTIFVFGSNPEGRHGAGAAKVAREQFGAVYGQGEGLQGNAYALPTKDLRVKENRGFKSISPEQITNSIKKLYETAKQNPNKQFKVAYRNTTDTSLNGYTGLEMIEMFNQAGPIPSNVIFSKEWADTNKLNPQLPITPEQEQEVQQKFQEYVNTTGKQDIEGFREFVEAENNYEKTDRTYILGSEEDIRGFKKFVEDEGSTTLKARLTPYDIISYYIQQYNASVGKDDVGIAANGVKAFLGLTDYYNNFYKNELPTMSSIEIIRSGKIFNKEFTFFDSTNSPRNYKINAIADLQIPRNSRNIISNILGDSFNYLNSNAALNLSGFLSGATDNAKELLMAKVNATTDLAAVHMYLTILGLDPDNVVEIMTSKVVEDIIKRREGNLFKDKYQTSIPTIMDDLENVYRGNKILSNNLKVFKDLYYSAKELTSLSSLFGVNQKRKANTWEIYKYLSKFERVFNDTNTNFLGKINVDNLNDANSNSLNNLIGKIIEKNNLSKRDRTYVKDTILKATNILVKYVDYDGKTKEKNVNLIKDGLDFRYYINDPNYKQIVKDYYNLIKHTFNVFDIVDSIPHYKGMIDSLVLMHNILLKKSKKYNFVTNTLKDVINIGDTLIQDFSKDYIDEQVINRGVYLFDTMIIENWLHTVAKNVNFKLKDIMQLANVNNYQIYISNEAKNIIKEDGISPTVKTININDSSNPVISLDSAYGIAQFKKIFEELILPILQNNLQSDFSDYLKVETVLTPFRTIGSAVVSTFPLQELNNPVFIKQFQKLLNTFDFLDSDSKVKGVIKNSVGNDVKLRDLFFIYNLITNNEKYGNKKLTPIFENYMQEKDSLGYDYMKFWSDFEHNSKGLLPIDTSMEDWKENFEDNILFHIANEKGVLSINRGKFKRYSVDNPHFTLISDISLSREQENNRRNLYETLRVLRERGFIINLKC